MWMRWVAVAYLIAVAACGFEHGESTPPDAFEVFPDVQFEMASSTADEASGTVQIGIVLSEPSTEIVAVSYDVTGGNAIRPDDYGLADGTVTFLAGQTRRTIDVTIVPDTLEEADETVIVTLSGPSHAHLGATLHHTLTISSDILPRVSFGNGATTTALEATDEQIQAVLTIAPKEQVTVQLSVAGSASPGGVDHALVDGQTLTFPVGVTTQMVPLGVVQDLLDEDDETVVLGFKNPSAKLLLAATGITHQHTITDDDPMPTVEFALSASSTPENMSATLTVSLSAVSGRMVTVGYSVTGGTASIGDAAVVGAPGTLTFMPGQLTQTIAVTVNNDALDEADETVIVSLANPANATLGTVTSHTLTIADDDNPPSVSFAAATASTNEGNAGTTVVNLAVNLSTASGQDVIVPFSVVGSAVTAANNPADYTIVASPITIPAGMTTANIAITVVGDTLDESNETVTVLLGAPTNATLGAITTEVLTINDDDATPTVAFTSAGTSPSEANANVTLTVQLSAVSGRDVTVPYTINAASTATNPADYTISPASPVTISAGQLSATITIAMVEDTADEPDETVIVDLDTPTNATLGAQSTYTLTITNDDTPQVSWNPAESNSADPEGTGPPGPPTRQVTFTMVLTAAASQTVTVPILYTGTAAPTTDYTGPASVTFLAGATSADVTLTIQKDNVNESNEAITMTIDSANVVGATAKNPTVRTYTIQDDD